MTYYAIKCGRVPGIYTTWGEAERQISKFTGAKYKKFTTLQDAESFMQGVETGKTEYKQKDITSFFKSEEPHETETSLICFTDGSCLKNGSVEAVGGFAVVWPFHDTYNHAEKLTSTTNNRAEYSALVHALTQIDRIDSDKKKTLIVYTDSQLMINSLTKWFTGWQKNNYVKKDGHPVANLDLILSAKQLMKNRTVQFRHVRAHTNADTWEAKYNSLVDSMARNAASS